MTSSGALLQPKRLTLAVAPGRRGAVDTDSDRRSWPFARAGGIAAILAAVLLLAGMVGLVMGLPALRNWLAVLVGINSASGGVALVTLHVVNPVDILILVLGALAFSGFWPGPARPHRLWMGLAIGLPLVGIAVLLATGLAGRSGLMGGGLVLASLMLGGAATKLLGYVGILANALLLVGDFGTVGSRSVLLAAIVGVGYALLVVWVLWMAARLVTAPRPPGQPSHA